MANDSYLRQLTRNVVLTSLLAGSTSGVGCALNNPIHVGQSSVDVKFWRMTPNALFVEYDGSVFKLEGETSLQGENALMMVTRLNKLVGGEMPSVELLQKSADLLTIISANFDRLPQLYEGDSRKLKFKRAANVTNLDSWQYYIPFTTGLKSIEEAKIYYKGL